MGRRRRNLGVTVTSLRDSAYQTALATHRLTGSMSRRGNCYDNAAMESFFSSLKEELHADRWSTRAAAHRDVADYIERFYNSQRLHSTLTIARRTFEARS